MKNESDKKGEIVEDGGNSRVGSHGILLKK
jgi:hypothetical protein